LPVACRRGGDVFEDERFNRDYCGFGDIDDVAGYLGYEDVQAYLGMCADNPKAVMQRLRRRLEKRRQEEVSDDS